MLGSSPLQSSRSRFFWMAVVAGSFAIGVFAGWLFTYGDAVDHPISKTPVSVDFCFWVSHPDLFRGQPVQTEAKYTQLIEGGAIGKDECQDLDVANYWSRTDDPVREEWEKDLDSNFFAAQFQLSFVGTIPAYPRYVDWRNAFRNRSRPYHTFTTFRVDRLIRFKRIQ